jgi:hypothetical protein
MFPKLVIVVIELTSAQGQESIQPIWSPAYASSLGAGIHHSFTGRLSNATAHMHALCTKSGIAYALGISGEVVHRFFWHTPAFVIKLLLAHYLGLDAGRARALWIDNASGSVVELNTQQQPIVLATSWNPQPGWVHPFTSPSEKPKSEGHMIGE